MFTGFRYAKKNERVMMTWSLCLGKTVLAAAQVFRAPGVLAHSCRLGCSYRTTRRLGNVCLPITGIQ